MNTPASRESHERIEDAFSWIKADYSIVNGLATDLQRTGECHESLTYEGSFKTSNGASLARFIQGLLVFGSVDDLAEVLAEPSGALDLVDTQK